MDANRLRVTMAIGDAGLSAERLLELDMQTGEWVIIEESSSFANEESLR
jgi:hypothetical protein